MNTLIKMFSLCLCFSALVFASPDTKLNDDNFKLEPISIIGDTEGPVYTLKSNSHAPTGDTRDCEACEFDWTNYGSECCDSAWDEYGLNCADLEANYNWDCAGCLCPGDEEGECGDGTCNVNEDCESCESDCGVCGECGDGEVPDCADNDCCPESWIGDGFADCEDQAYGCDLTCYDNDGGDCAPPECGDGTCNGDETEASCPEDCASSESCNDCEFDFTNYGSECCDTAWDEFGISCADLEANYSWDCAGCNCPGDLPGECGDGSCNVNEDCETCPEDCGECGTCPDGQVLDCDGSNECWPESWIGDGFADCNDQQYGADLTCYDCDGSDCPESDPGCGGLTCEEQGLITCFDGSCAATNDDCVSDCPAGTIPDCSGDGDCCYESWLSNGICEDAAFESEMPWLCDLSCYDNDGGDCDGDGGRAQPNTLKKKGYGVTAVEQQKGRIITMVRSGNATQTPSRDGIVINHSATAVRMGEVISNSTREVLASINFEVVEGYNLGWTGAWDADPAQGEFTLYGLDASDYVCGTIAFCDGAACSDTVGPVCAMAGDMTSSECAEGSDCASDAGSGDVNGDGSSDVLDIVSIVNYILGGSLDECQMAAADMNSDGNVDVLDIVQIVNGILGGRVDDASSAKLIKGDDVVVLEANGYIGGIQMKLSHDGDFSIDLTDNALVAKHNTVGNETILVIVAPEGEELFTYSGDFEIVDMIVANSQDRVNVGAPTEFALSTAYPNPFNPTTSLELSVPANGQVTVQVYNLMGQVVATLANGYMDASIYTLTWDASDVSSGMYIVKAEAAGIVTSQKLMFIK